MRRPSPVDLMLIATIVIWAFNITVTKYVLTHGFQPLAYGAIRYGAAAILAVAVAVVLEGSLRVGGRRNLALVGAALRLPADQPGLVRLRAEARLGDHGRADPRA